ncbi:MAG: DUF4178 domain-containing protein [Chloroflexi bacterium]|nr:DUF4178 domain-containing protein [Chloroflexota bacterium]
MDNIQQRIVEIAQQIPEYVGYQAKERRRDADKLVRRQLAAKYDAPHTRLRRIARQAPLEHITEIENLDQKLLRLIARLQTAPGGYAGWFDAGQIVEGDLDQLTQFDASLADGVAALTTAMDKVAGALKTKVGVEDAIGECADLLDKLNAQFDQREQFLSMGKKPSLEPPPSPLDALKAKQAPPAELVALGNLKLRDAVSFGGTDYLVAGKLVYSISGGPFWALMLQDGGQKRWLRVGPGNELAVCDEIVLDVRSPLPDTLEYDGQSFVRGDAGSANVSVEGAGGTKRGSANYARYRSDAGSHLWVEDFGSETRTMAGQAVDASELRVYRR